MRKRKFIETGAVVHIYNRGVRKGDIVFEKYDSIRFLKSMFSNPIIPTWELIVLMSGLILLISNLSMNGKNRMERLN